MSGPCVISVCQQNHAIQSEAFKTGFAFRDALAISVAIPNAPELRCKRVGQFYLNLVFYLDTTEPASPDKSHVIFETKYPNSEPVGFPVDKIFVEPSLRFFRGA